MGIGPLRRPPGNQIRALAFLIMINDLVVEKVGLLKYVDDTTISETVAKGEQYNGSSTMVTRKRSPAEH